MYQGSCHCGKIQYEINGELGPIVCCHCSQCRKSQGSAFATNAPVNTNDFHLLDGEEYISEYPNSEDKIRAFRQNFGSPIYSPLKSKPDQLTLKIRHTRHADCSKTFSTYFYQFQS
jgi:hypothetical protein